MIECTNILTFRSRIHTSLIIASYEPFYAQSVDILVDNLCEVRGFPTPADKRAKTFLKYSVDNYETCLRLAKSHLKHMFPGNLLAVGYPQVSVEYLWMICYKQCAATVF